jgi:hypothetical protein
MPVDFQRMWDFRRAKSYPEALGGINSILGQLYKIAEKLETNPDADIQGFQRVI